LGELAAEGAEEEAAAYYIKKIDITITGRTRKDAVMRAGAFVMGEELRDDAALDAYIERKKEALLNNRALAEVIITYRVEDEEDGRKGLIIHVEARDTRNFIILPEPKYTSNAGFEPALKLRDYNFLGTLTPLKIDLGYTLDEFHLERASKGQYSISVEAQAPFRAAGREWRLKEALGLRYVSGEGFAFENTSGIALDFPFAAPFHQPFSQSVFTAGFDQGLRVKDEYYTFEKRAHDAIYENIVYMYSLPYARLVVPLGVRRPWMGELLFRSSLSAEINYRLAGAELGTRRGPLFSFQNGVGFDRINWRGNLREGAALFFSVESAYNVHFAGWNNAVSLNAAAHKPLFPIFALSSRLRGKVWLNKMAPWRDEARLEAGSMLRGILDRSLRADAILALNLDFPLRALRFMPSEWFKTQKLRYFNFELYLSPIIDTALYEGERLDDWGRPVETSSFTFGNALLCAGVEALVFPLAWRSLFLRVSVAWNMREAFRLGALPSGGDREIFIGLGHYY
jgi:hypothetical protein